MKMDEVGSPNTTNLSESMELVQDSNQNMSPKKKNNVENGDATKGKKYDFVSWSFRNTPPKFKFLLSLKTC